MRDASTQPSTVAAPQYYRPAERIDRELFIWFPIVGGIGAIVLGLVYSFIAYLVGQIMEKPSWMIIVTPFYGAALMALARWVCQLGKVRSRRLRLRVAIATGILGLYVAWQIYILFAASDRAIFDPKPTWHMSPWRLLHAMWQLSQDRGFSSWLIWLIEAALVFAMIVSMMGDSDPQVPFCEKCGQWTKELFSIHLEGFRPSALEDFKKGDLKRLEQLAKPPHSKSSYVQLRVLQCSCLASRYACIENVTVTPGTSGGISFNPLLPGDRPKMHYRFGKFASTDVKPAVDYMEISAETQKKLEAIRDGLREK